MTDLRNMLAPCQDDGSGICRQHSEVVFDGRCEDWGREAAAYWFDGQSPRALAALDVIERLPGIIDQLSRRYDDQWAVGPVLLPDLDDLRAALDRWEALP